MTFAQIKARYVDKLAQRVWMIASEFFIKWHNYSFLFALYSSAWWIGWYCAPLRKLCMWAHQKKTCYMSSFCKDQFGDILKKYQCVEHGQSVPVDMSDFFIWVFWAQGMDNAPHLVQCCYKQLLKTNGDRVKLITCNNLSEYLEIPEHIKQKVDSGSISLTHYSDIIRMSLLAKYGGLWLDATCWVAKKIPETIKKQPFYSCKSDNVDSLPLWSNSNWCTWSLGTGLKEYPIFSFVRDSFYKHLYRSTLFPDYLFQDFLIEFVRLNNLRIAEDIEHLPANNQRRNELYFLLNKAYDEAVYNELTADTWLYKLSYKHLYVEKTPDGRPTFYGKMIRGEL